MVAGSLTANQKWDYCCCCSKSTMETLQVVHRSVSQVSLARQCDWRWLQQTLKQGSDNPDFFTMSFYGGCQVSDTFSKSRTFTLVLLERSRLCSKHDGGIYQRGYLHLVRSKSSSSRAKWIMNNEWVFFSISKNWRHDKDLFFFFPFSETLLPTVSD